MRKNFAHYSLITLIGLSGISYASITNTNQSMSSKLQRYALSKDPSNVSATIKSSANCLSSALFANYSGNTTSGSIKTELYIANYCNVNINLSHYHINFLSQDENGQSVLINPIDQVYPTFSSDVKGSVNFAFSNSSLPGFLIGKFVNLSQNNHDLIIKPGDDLIFSGVTNILHPIKYISPPIETPIILNYAMEIEELGDDTHLNYGRDSLVDIPVGAHGLKTLVVTNYSLNRIYNISFPNKLPSDITYDMKFSTCSLNGNQQLAANESCNLVFRYNPQVEGVNNLLPITVTGVDSSNQQLIVAPSVGLQYTSRLTNHSSPGTRVGPGAKIGGITLSTPEYITYDRDSLEHITVGDFGLKSYVITNTSSVTLYAVTLPALTNWFSYDVRTTCNLNNKLILAPNQSCLMVIKYLPSIHSDQGNLAIQVAGVDPYDYTVFINDILEIPYSSNK